MSTTSTPHTITVQTADDRHEIEAEPGLSLREALCRHGLSPHGAVTEVANCGGQGHCGVCAVEITENAPPSDQWFDQGLEALGGRRLSCQVQVDRDMAVRL